METILSISNISKAYGPVQALRSVSFAVPSGSVYGVLGPNGSGKTTLLGILLNVLVADEGSYSWFGNMAPELARRQIGSLLETPNFYHYMTAVDNLKISAAIKQRGADDIERVLRIVGLWERRNSKFQTYSLGMKQRLAIASALLGGPKALVLDEPTNGLDPAGIAEIRELIRKLNSEGITIIIASHLLDEVEKVCTHVAILKKGELLLNGKVDEVLHSEDRIEVKSADMAALQQIASRIPGVEKVVCADGYCYLTIKDGVLASEVNRYCHEEGLTLSHLVLKKKSLESKFMELTN